MFRLTGYIQNYDWGKTGIDSLVGCISNSNLNLLPNDKIPYAEYWLGTHSRGDAFIEECNMYLSEYIGINPCVLGTSLNELPFLFKILSIRKPLSIQAHPDKQLAEELHLVYPDIYGDSNHKPEMMIALGDFELLYGFRPISEIMNFLSTISEFRELVSDNIFKEMNNYIDGIDNLHTEADILSIFFSYYMNNNTEYVYNVVIKYIRNLISRSVSNDIDKLVLRLNHYHEGDIGVFAPYIFNYLKLKKNESVFIGANEPHSYISGDCIECMACSDNVVRGGLTKKHIDINVLTSMLSYNTVYPIVIRPIVEMQVGYSIFNYVSPVSEFKLAHVVLGKNNFCNFKKYNSPIIMYIAKGNGYMLCNGSYKIVEKYNCLFIEANTDIKIITDKGLLSFYYAIINN
jgi:mannose-6-phosphate isomerase